MEKALLDFMTGKTRELIATPTCCAELKAVAEEWLAARAGPPGGGAPV